MFGKILAVFDWVSSPEPESVVCHRHCRKLLTFLSSSPELLGGFQPNLGQSITA